MKGPAELYGPTSAIVRSPMLRCAAPFITGIAWGFWRTPALLPVGGSLALLSFTVGLVLLFPVFRFSRWQRGLLIGIWCFTFGLFWQGLCDPKHDARHITHAHDTEGPWALRIETLNGITEKLIRADATIIGRSRDGNWARFTGKAMLTLMRQAEGADPRPGDEIVADAALEPVDRIPDPGGFDRRAWAASRGIERELFAPPEDWVTVGHSTRWTDAFGSMRDRISAWMAETGLPVRERALVKALVLGLRDELDGEQKSAFVKSGTVHVLAVSGTHVGFIYAMLLFLFGWWGGGDKGRIVRGLLILIALWGYAGLTGACPSVLRATFMFSLFTIAGMSAQRIDPLNSLFAAAMVLLLWDPHMLLEASFQLSFLAVLGIILFFGPLQRLWMPENWLLRNTWSLIALSLASQLFTTPLSLLLFKAFPVWFLPANLIVVTAAGIAVYGAVALLFLFKVPFLGAWLTWAMTLLLTLVDRTTAFFAELPGAYPAVRIGTLEMILLYVLVFAFAGHWLWRLRGSRWIIGSVTGLLLVCWIARATGSHDRTTFTVYDDRHALHASFSVGRDLVVLCEPDSFATDPRLQQKIDRHQRYAGLDAPLFLSPATLASDSIVTQGPTLAAAGFWGTARSRIRFLDADRDPATASAPRSDAVVLHDMISLDETELERYARLADHIVLAGNMGWRARNFARQWCADHGRSCHDIRDQGAFILER